MLLKARAKCSLSGLKKNKVDVVSEFLVATRVCSVVIAQLRIMCSQDDQITESPAATVRWLGDFCIVLYIDCKIVDFELVLFRQAQVARGARQVEKESRHPKLSRNFEPIRRLQMAFFFFAA